ncbi:MAG: hypothetical protein ABIG71_03905 [Candidatus Uhrbacteria bacterium]
MQRPNERRVSLKEMVRQTSRCGDFVVSSIIMKYEGLTHEHFKRLEHVCLEESWSDLLPCGIIDAFGVEARDFRMQLADIMQGSLKRDGDGPHTYDAQVRIVDRVFLVLKKHGQIKYPCVYITPRAVRDSIDDAVCMFPKDEQDAGLFKVTEDGQIIPCHGVDRAANSIPPAE